MSYHRGKVKVEENADDAEARQQPAKKGKPSPPAMDADGLRLALPEARKSEAAAKAELAEAWKSEAAARKLMEDAVAEAAEARKLAADANAELNKARKLEAAAHTKAKREEDARYHERVLHDHEMAALARNTAHRVGAAFDNGAAHMRRIAFAVSADPMLRQGLIIPSMDRARVIGSMASQVVHPILSRNQQ